MDEGCFCVCYGWEHEAFGWRGGEEEDGVEKEEKDAYLE